MQAYVLFGLAIIQAILAAGLLAALIWILRLKRALGGKKLHELVEDLQSKVERLEEKGNRNTDLFKTVLHGFDFIVQGCKKAIEASQTTSDPVLPAGEPVAALSSNGSEEIAPQEPQQS